MNCHICRGEADRQCADCGKPCCEDCRADFPHHVRPHVRCEYCYYFGKGKMPPKRRQRADDEDDDNAGEEWKK